MEGEKKYQHPSWKIAGSLAPITRVVPKPLFPIGNIPLIGYAFKLLKHHGITEAAVNMHHLADKMRAALGDGSGIAASCAASLVKLKQVLEQRERNVLRALPQS